MRASERPRHGLAMQSTRGLFPGAQKGGCGMPQRGPDSPPMGYPSHLGWLSLPQRRSRLNAR
eukprot:12892691-Prorocentrum_lima.AAC.1